MPKNTDKRRDARKGAILYTLLCAAGIWYLCLMRPPSVKLDFTNVPGFDKVVHVGMYAVLCGLLWFEYLRHHTRLRPLRLRVWIKGRAHHAHPARERAVLHAGIWISRVKH